MLDATPAPIHHASGREDTPLIACRGVSFWYGDKQALSEVDLDVYPREVLAFMGPSGCGKTTLLKCFNRMHDGDRGARMTGSLRLDGAEVMDEDVDPPMLRRHFGWVAQKPNPFPASVYENVAYGPRLHGLVEADGLDAFVERCLRRADLWDEVKDRLEETGFALSGGQQQRLCIARALSTQPEVVLMDEPCSAIDPIATEHIEGLIRELARDLTVVIITHSLTQARRIADRVAFFHMGRMVEVGPMAEVFEHPRHPHTRAYLAGATG